MSSFADKLRTLAKNPYSILLHWNAKGYFKNLSDKTTLKLIWLGAYGKRLNLKNPTTFNEKLQWLKLYDRKPIYTTMVDKCDAKKYVADIIGGEYIVPTLGVWERFDDIDFDSLPDKFVLKTTHDSGGVFICKDKSKMDFEKARALLEPRLSKSWYIRNREWSYKNVVPRIIAEEFLVDADTCELSDYKFYCFNGEPKMVLIATDRQNLVEETKFDFFDMEFKHLKITKTHPNSKVKIEEPANFELMKTLAAKVAQGTPFLRMDFYEANGHVYFGECTFYPQSGLSSFEPDEVNYELGDMIVLPEKTND